MSRHSETDLSISSADVEDVGGVEEMSDDEHAWRDYDPFTSLITWMARGGQPGAPIDDYIDEQSDTSSFLERPLSSAEIAARFTQCIEQAVQEAESRAEHHETGSGSSISFLELSETKYMSIHANTIRLYCRGALPRHHARQLEYLISRSTNAWLLSLLTLPATQVVRWCRRPEDAIHLAIRAALLTRFDTIRQDGYRVFSSKGAPLIYTSTATSTRSIKLALQDLCLPFDCVRLVSCRDQPGFEEVMDTDKLIKAIKNDRRQGRVPLLAIANVGTDLCGHIDDTEAIRAITSDNNMWMHVQGTGVAVLATDLAFVPKNLTSTVRSIAKADSVTATPSSWFDLLEPLSCVIFRPPVPSSLPVTLPVLSVLPLWIHIQQMGSEQLVKAFSRSYGLVYRVAGRIAGLSSINLVGPWLDEFREDGRTGKPRAKSNGIDQPTEDSRSSGNPHRITNNTPPSLSLCVMFEYVPAFLASMGPKDPRRPSILARLPKWQSELYRSLQEAASPVLRPHIDTAIVNDRIVLRFHPGELDDNYVGEFVTHLATTTYNFDSVLLCQDKFRESVTALENFEFIATQDMESVCGLGAMRYKPAYISDVDEDASLLNESIAARLRNSDDVFQPITLEDGRTVILVGVSAYPMLPERVEQLVEFARSVAEAVEESPEVVESLERVLVENIKHAEQKVVKANEEQFYEEGIVRHLPIIGSLWSWMSPVEEKGHKGVSFDLPSRQLLETEQKKKAEAAEAGPQEGKKPQGGEGGSPAKGQRTSSSH